MKKIIFLFFAMAFLCLSSNAGVETFSGVGVQLFKEPYNNKVLIVNVLNNTPAQKLGIKTGGEIIGVNGKSVKKLCLCEISNLIRGQEGEVVELMIRESFWKTRRYKITRGIVEYYKEDETKEFYDHWMQIAPVKFCCDTLIPNGIVKKLSFKYKRSVLPKVKYWAQRKIAFRRAYESCLNYSENNKEYCLVNLMNREIEKTNSDMNIYKNIREDFKELK